MIFSIHIKIEVDLDYKIENYNLIDRDKNKVEKLTKREKVKKRMIGITRFVTLSLFAYKVFLLLYDLNVAL